jgi:hypothetical protein
MKNVLLIMALFALVLLSATETQAQCACMAERINMTPQKELDLAHAVFVGKVIAIKESPRDKDRGTASVTFQVSKVWKRDLDSNLTLTNTTAGCVSGFKEDEEWLIYAYRNEEGALYSLCCCTRTTLLERAGEDMKAFADYPMAKILRPKDIKN